MTTPRDVLDFWFGAPDAPHFGASRPEWFVKDDDFDTAIRARFGAAVDLALRGGLEDWPADFAGALALVILLDQFPRNIYRGSAKMFDGDVRARAVASQALELAAITSATPQAAHVSLFTFRTQRREAGSGTLGPFVRLHAGLAGQRKLDRLCVETQSHRRSIWPISASQ